MNSVLTNIWKGEAENKWHDEMMRIFLGEGKKRMQDRRVETSFNYCFEAGWQA